MAVPDTNFTLATGIHRFENMKTILLLIIGLAAMAAVAQAQPSNLNLNVTVSAEAYAGLTNQLAFVNARRVTNGIPAFPTVQVMLQDGITNQARAAHRAFVEQKHPNYRVLFYNATPAQRAAALGALTP